MFCGKCGANNTDNAEFCAECGAKLNGGQTIENASDTLRNSSDKNRKVGMIAMAFIAVVVILIAFLLFGGRSYEETVEQFINAQFEADAEDIVKLIPDEMVDYILEEEGYDSDEIDEFIDEGNDKIQEQLDYIEKYLGEDWNISYEILSVEELSGSDLEDLRDDYEDIDVKVSAAKIVEIQLTIKAEDMENSNTMEIPVIRVGRSWCLDMQSMGSFF